MKSSVAPSPKGRPAGKPQRPARKSGSWSFGMRRLTKRQRERLFRMVVTVFLVIFAVSIIGALVAVTGVVPK